MTDHRRAKTVALRIATEHDEGPFYMVGDSGTINGPNKVFGARMDAALYICAEPINYTAVCAELRDIYEAANGSQEERLAAMARRLEEML